MSESRDQVGSLSQEEEWQLRIALSSPRGGYGYERASQLSGVPRRTVHYWAHEGLVVPDYVHQRPMAWSYRDLVLLRFFAWLRSKGMKPQEGSKRVTYVRRLLAESLGNVREIRSDGRSIFIGAENLDRETNWQAMNEVVGFIGVFDLLAPLDEVGHVKQLWGPHLIRPSRWTYISPLIMGGQPCVRDSRIPTSALFALHHERGLQPLDIAGLYGNLQEVAVVDSIHLEERIRRLGSDEDRVEQPLPT